MYVYIMLTSVQSKACRCVLVPAYISGRRHSGCLWGGGSRGWEQGEREADFTESIIF